MLTAALAYAAAGIYVLPVRRGDQEPRQRRRQDWHAKSSRDPQQIAAWFAGTDHGIALHCGRSGLVVFDVDKPEQGARGAGPAPRVSAVSVHPPRRRPKGPLPFAMPPGRTLGNGTGGLGGEWGEVRGLNGVIVVAPSRHANGGEYRWVRTGPVLALPDEIAELLPDGNATEDAATDDAGRRVRRRAHRSHPTRDHGRLDQHAAEQL